MFLDDQQSYTQFCGLSTFDDKMFYKQTTFNKTCNWNARRSSREAWHQKTDFALIELKSGHFRIHNFLLFFTLLLLLNYFLYNLFLFLQKSGGGGAKAPQPLPLHSPCIHNLDCKTSLLSRFILIVISTEALNFLPHSVKVCTCMGLCSLSLIWSLREKCVRGCWCHITDTGKASYLYSVAVNNYCNQAWKQVLFYATRVLFHYRVIW